MCTESLGNVGLDGWYLHWNPSWASRIEISWEADKNHIPDLNSTGSYLEVWLGLRILYYHTDNLKVWKPLVWQSRRTPPTKFLCMYLRKRFDNSVYYISLFLCFVSVFQSKTCFSVSERNLAYQLSTLWTWTKNKTPQKALSKSPRAPTAGLLECNTFPPHFQTPLGVLEATRDKRSRRERKKEEETRNYSINYTIAINSMLMINTLKYYTE